MNDAIYRQAAIEAIWHSVGSENGELQSFAEAVIADAEEEIKALPSAQPERKKGQWSFIGGNMFECTCCGTPYTTQQLNGLRNYNTDPYAPKFCPNCGADMREPEDIPMEYFESGGR